jgi:ribosome biogenesis GTPase A
MKEQVGESAQYQGQSVPLSGRRDEITEPDTAPIAPAMVQDALRTIEVLCRRHEVSALEDFLESCRTFAQEKTLNIAVLGRFKAGKSSFLNHLLGRPLLPIGVIPVTSVVTEIQWGPHERAEILFADGRRDQVPLGRIADYISESHNPENSKQVARVCVELPSMDRYRGIRFVDTPGLESVFEHNTDASLEWLPAVPSASQFGQSPFICRSPFARKWRLPRG